MFIVVYFSLLFLLVVNSIRGLYPKDTHEWLTWIQKNKALYLNKEKVQALIDQQRRNPADVNYLDLDLISKIVRDFQNASGEFENSSRNSVSPEADVTETAPFKNWFGDSKVVDESGKPLEVYHGTNWDGWEFDTENGAFFSEKEDYAEEMAAQRGGSRIVKAYLSIRNPLVVKVPGNKMADPEFEARIIAEAKSKGHDGVKLETDTDNEIAKDVFWVAFEPNQIKSATDNVGTFDPGNNDVRFSVAPDEELELVQGNSNSESGMRDAELELVRGGSEMAADESGKYFPAPDEWGTAYTSMTGKGLQAIMFLLEKKDGFVPAAFNRPEIGDIDIVYGKTGFGIDDEGGYGLAHIEKRRGKGHVDWGIFANTLTNGTYVPKNKSTVYFVNKKSKVIVKLSFKEFKRKWVVSAMGNDLTFAADRLLASNPGEAAKQGVAPKGLYTIGDVFDKIKLTSNEKSEKTSEKINGGTDEYGDGVRSSLINLDLTEDERSLVNIMKALVSGQFNPDFDYAQRVKDVYGLEVSAEDAKFAAMVALREKKADAQRAAREKAYAYFRSNNPLFEFIDDFAGGFHDFHIVPVNGKGEKFTGTFISPEYVKWSEKRPQGKNESDKRYQKYLHDREEALKKAKGYDSADLAERACITICLGNSRVCDINFILTGSGIRRWSSLIVLFFRDAGTGEGAFPTAVLRDGNDARDLVRQIGNVADHAHQLAAAVEFG